MLFFLILRSQLCIWDLYLLFWAIKWFSSWAEVHLPVSYVPDCQFRLDLHMYSHKLEPGKPWGSHSCRWVWLHCLLVVCVSWASNTILAVLPKLFLLLTCVLKACSWILLLFLELKFMDDPGWEHFLFSSVCCCMCSGKDVFTPKFLVLRPFPSITSMNHVTNASLLNLWSSYLDPWLKPSLSVIFFNDLLLRAIPQWYPLFELMLHDSIPV